MYIYFILPTNFNQNTNKRSQPMYIIIIIIISMYIMPKLDAFSKPVELI